LLTSPCLFERIAQSQAPGYWSKIYSSLQRQNIHLAKLFPHLDKLISAKPLKRHIFEFESQRQAFISAEKHIPRYSSLQTQTFTATTVLLNKKIKNTFSIVLRQRSGSYDEDIVVRNLLDNFSISDKDSV
jgi:hypothetical protein